MATSALSEVRFVGDFAVDPEAADADAARGHDLAVGDLDGASGRRTARARAVAERPLAAVEDEAGQADVVRIPGGGDQRKPVGQDEPRRTAHADKLRAGRQRDIADPIDAGAEWQAARACARLPRSRAAIALV